MRFKLVVHVAAFVTMAACSSAHAAKFAPIISGADFSKPLQTNVGYTITIDLNPYANYFSFYSGQKTSYCDHSFSSSPAYCVTQVAVRPASSTLLSSTFDGDDASAVVRVSGNALQVPFAAGRDLTEVFTFTQSFTETRTASQYRTSSNPALDGARTDLYTFSKLVPPPSQTGPLSCSYAVGADVLTTTATCVLSVSFASPVLPPAPGGGAVPEPATWALLIGGFAIVGAAMRRQRAAAPAYA